MSTFSQFNSGVKSYQTGYTRFASGTAGDDYVVYGDLTISSVNTNKSLIFCYTDLNYVPGTNVMLDGTIRFLSSTSIRFTWSDSSAPTIYFRWMVIEFY